MKSKVLKAVVGSVLFLMLVAASLAALQPVYRRMNGAIAQIEQKYLSLLTQKTGLEVSYQSLSPSILAGIRIKGIVVRDASTGEEVFTAKKAVVSYSLRKLLARDVDHAFSRLTISDVDFDFGMQKNAAILETIRASLLGGEKKPKSPDEPFIFPPSARSALSTVLSVFPFDVVLKNITAHLEHPQVDLTVAVKNLRVQKQSDGALGVTGKGTALCGVRALGWKTAGFTYILSGTLLPALDDSTLIATIGELSRADYSLYRGEFLARYADQHLAVQSMQRILPYAFWLDLDFDSSDLALALRMQDFNPFTLLKAPRFGGIAQDFVGTTASGDLSLSYNIVDGTLGWSADGSASLSRKIAPGGQQLTFDLSGDNENVLISSLGASGSIAGGTLNGSLYLPLMQPSGVLSLDHYTLPNGARVSGDLYVDPVGDGFAGFIPELHLGNEQVFTAVQVEIDPQDDKSYDFVLSFSDYTHQEVDMPGTVTAEGTITPTGQRWVQAWVEMNYMFIDSVVRAAAFALPDDTKDTLLGVAQKAEPYIMANEFYVSSDFSSLSYNAPVWVIANTQVDGQSMLLSFDGSDSSVSVSQLRLAFGNNSLSATADVDFDLAGKSAFFTTALDLNDIPYGVTGTLTDGRWLSVAGDYGLNVSADLHKPLSGTAQIVSFPLSLEGYLLTLSLDSAFSYTDLYGLTVDISSFEAEETSGKISFMPHVAVTGTLNDDGFVMQSLSYADNVSSLNGDGYVLWNRGDGIFDSFTARLGVTSDITSERITFDASLVNPMQTPLDAEHLQTDWFLDASLLATGFPVGRLMPGQNTDDTASLSVIASGTLENPFVTATLQGFSMEFNGSPLVLRGSFTLEDQTLGIQNLDASWNGFSFDNLTAGIDLAAFSGAAQAEFDMKFMGKTLSAPLSLTVQNPGPSREGQGLLSLLKVPEEFSVFLDSRGLSGNVVQTRVPLHVELNRYPGMIEFRTDEVFGLSGYLTEGNNLTVMIEDIMPLHFFLDGTVSMQDIDLSLTNFYLDLSQFSYLFNSDVFWVYRGIVTGELAVSGLATDPAMEGVFVLDGADFNIPAYIPDHMTAKRLQLTLHDNTLNVPLTEFSIKDTAVNARATVELDRWALSSMRASVVSQGTKGIPIDARASIAHVEGRATVDANLEYSDGVMDLSGNFGLNNATISLMDSGDDDDDDLYDTPAKATAQESGGDGSLPFGITADIHFTVGEKVRVELNPILRSLVAPNNTVDITLDTSNETWTLKGEVALRGGEVTYLNRNFYLREGTVYLNETQSKMDPMLTVRAEMRERDSRGDTVTITLEATRQNLSRFSPRLYSSPAKSESELYELLGQVAIADSSSVSSLLLSAADYGVQVAVVRKIENALRDLLNFDIFSIRTSLLQNAVLTGLSSQGSSSNRASLGNYFDNSTVYIGKYLGSSLYADAMLHWTYDENKATVNGGLGGIVFQPEIGLEMDAPFAAIRWNFAPDLDNFADTLVSSASVTLSWRLTF